MWLIYHKTLRLADVWINLSKLVQIATISLLPKAFRVLLLAECCFLPLHCFYSKDMAGRSQSFLPHSKEARFSTTEDEDTEELAVHRGLHMTESSCTSPYLYRRNGSYLSSFSSVIYRESSEDESPFKPRAHLHELDSETTIQKIKRESDEAKHHLQSLARSLQAKTEEIRSSSILTSWEAKARKDYFGRLGERLDSLLEETRETQEMIVRMTNTTTAWRKLAGSGEESRLKLDETPANIALQLHFRRVSNGCALEGPETSKQACCSFLRN